MWIAKIDKENRGMCACGCRRGKDALKEARDEGGGDLSWAINLFSRVEASPVLGAYRCALHELERCGINYQHGPIPLKLAVWGCICHRKKGQEREGGGGGRKTQSSQSWAKPARRFETLNTEDSHI